MANEFRVPLDYFFGTLTTAAAVSDTTLTSTNSFASLGTGYTTGVYLPLVLHDPVTKVREVVWVTAHTAASNSVTVVRGKEGTSAQSWPSGTQITCAPTQRDGNLVLPRASLPTDQAIGTRATLSDEAVALVSTLDSGWFPQAGVSKPSSAGPNRSAVNPSAHNTIQLRGGYLSGVTNGSGNITYTYREAFPNATIAPVASVASSSSTAIIAMESETASTFTVGVYNPATGTKYGAGVTVAVFYNAFGY
jgi:hypothetical protein